MEESLLALISSHIFPNLEVIRIKNEYLRLSSSKIRAKTKLMHLKKLDLSGCIVKVDGGVSKLSSREKYHKYYKMVKKKALGKNYARVRWQDSPDSEE